MISQPKQGADNHQSGMTGKRATYIIGIDPGTNAGFAVYDRASMKLIEVRTVSAHEAWDRLRTMKHAYGVDMLHVRWEDARLRTWFGKAGRERLKGVGSIERDCTLMADFLKREGISNEAVAPKNIKTKADPVVFARLTGWAGRTSNHGRDAAMIVFGY